MTVNQEIIGRTKSVCPDCLFVIDAYKVVREGGIYLEKHCAIHGDFSVLIWEGDLASYEAWDQSNKKRDEIPMAKPYDKGCPYDCGLCAAHVRSTCCVLLELTKRCNLRCPICFADAGGVSPDPTLEEIDAQYALLNRNGGGFNIQLSGGEPTVRDDLPAIIQLGRKRGFSFFQLNTNGIRLGREEGYAKTLKEAGLNTVFLQFDGTDARVYETIRGADVFFDKLEAIKNCEKAGLGVVLVPTLVPGVNTDEIGAILEFAESYLPTVRGVHFQPISYFGRYGEDPPEWRITIPYVLQEIEKQTGGRMQARDFVGGGAENAYCSFHANYLRDASGNLSTSGRENTGCCCGVTSKQSQEVVAHQWSLRAQEENPDGFAEWLAERHDNTLAISGMLFQDAWTLDLERLRQCYISEVDGDDKMVPFCAYNLTARDGRSLYRGAEACDRH